MSSNNTVRCRYNAISFLKNTNNWHSIPRPHGRVMGCLLWVKGLGYVLSRSLQQGIHYRVMLHHVVTAHRYQKDFCEHTNTHRHSVATPIWECFAVAEIKTTLAWLLDLSYGEVFWSIVSYHGDKASIKKIFHEFILSCYMHLESWHTLCHTLCSA